MLATKHTVGNAKQTAAAYWWFGSNVDYITLHEENSSRTLQEAVPANVVTIELYASILLYS